MRTLTNLGLLFCVCWLASMSFANFKLLLMLNAGANVFAPEKYFVDQFSQMAGVLALGLVCLWFRPANETKR